MDIEGSEFLALRGMGPLLAECFYLQFEYHEEALVHVSGASTEDFSSLLEEHFSLLHLVGSDHRARRPDFLPFLKEIAAQEHRADILATK